MKILPPQAVPPRRPGNPARRSQPVLPVAAPRPPERREDRSPQTPPSTRPDPQAARPLTETADPRARRALRAYDSVAGLEQRQSLEMLRFHARA